MSDSVNSFYNSIEDVESVKQATLIDLFVYHLTVETGVEVVTPKMVDECFCACDLTPPKRTATHLSEGVKSRPQKFIRMGGGYKLQRHMREALSKQLGAEKIVAQTSATLRGIEHKLAEGATKSFLKETIDCFEAGANRATIVMAWILAMDHLFAYILAHRLAEFNAALAKSSDKSVKVKVIAQRDDFTEMKESKFIEFCRAAKIISNDVRKILDQKLETRNSSAHPSGVSITKTKVIDFVEDLVENVVMKYKV